MYTNGLHPPSALGVTITRLLILTLELYRVMTSVADAARLVDSDVIFPDIVFTSTSPGTIVPTVSEPFSNPEILLSPNEIPLDEDKVSVDEADNDTVPVDDMETDDCPIKSNVDSDITPKLELVAGLTK